MKLFNSLAMVTALALAAPAVQAAPLYADSVVAFTKGDVEVDLAGRSDPESALGVADGEFVSLGFGGSIVLAFGESFRAVGQVIEITFNDPSHHKETADVYAGDGVTWTLIASIENHISTSFSFVAGVFTQMMIVDTSVASGPSRDGFDIDSVEVSPVPVPAAGLLLGGALFGLGALRRRARKV